MVLNEGKNSLERGAAVVLHEGVGCTEEGAVVLNEGKNVLGEGQWN